MPIDPKKRIGSQSIHQMPQRRERFNEDFDAKSVNKSSTLTQKSLSIFHRVQQAKTQAELKSQISGSKGHQSAKSHSNAGGLMRPLSSQNLMD
jgi:hypothetical protein